jgi:drug/metabolite transporter (DMT)-like permease
MLAPASVVAPFDYTALIWGATFDWLIWSARAPVATILGAVLIVASGLYIMLRGHRAGEAVAADVPTALPADPPL